jgi:hypothetical protein
MSGSKSAGTSFVYNERGMRRDQTTLIPRIVCTIPHIHSLTA